MVARPGPSRRSANAGELDPALKGRPDIKQYYSGGLRYKHVEPVPQTGFTLMDGSDDMGPVRPRLAAAAVTGTTDTLGPHTGANSVIKTVSFDAVTAAGIEVAGLASDGPDFTWAAQVWSGGAWVTIASGLSGGNAAIDRFVAFAPGAERSATQARILATPAASASFVLPTLRAWGTTATMDVPRYRVIPYDDETGYMVSVGVGHADIWSGTTWVAAVLLPTVTASKLPQLGFYGEALTLGVFHRNLVSKRVRRAGTDAEWAVDDWPYDNVPGVDYGEDYPKTADEWTVTVRWTQALLDEAATMRVELRVEGESTGSIQLLDTLDANWTPGGAAADWDQMAADLQAALEGLPSLGVGVTVTASILPGKAVDLTVTFGGALSGREYDVEAYVTNTTLASALPTHTTIGDTEYEPIISARRGWPNHMDLLQDRACYYLMDSSAGALMMSQIAEYFQLNIEATGDSAARLDRLRTQTSEQILLVKETLYFLIFTNRAVYFVPERTIERNKPLTFVKTSEIGIAALTRAVELEGRIIYVADNRAQLLALVYDDLATKFIPDPQTLLSSHLIEGVIRTDWQRSTGDKDTPRMWILRSDGRLVCGKMILSQEILGFCEWLTAGAALKECAVDHFNRLWIVAQRGAALRHERLNPDTLFRQSVATATDLAGEITGLPYPDGAEIWARADGYILGPCTVAGGAIDLGEPYASVTCGYWQAPVYEDMPHKLINRNDEVVQRPGRIHSVLANVIDTESIAIGANDTLPEDIGLRRTGDPLDVPLPAKTELVERHGIQGVTMDPTVVITQVRPGKLTVRDFSVMERL